MKCLSIRQPWAWLVVVGIKPVENRKWYSAYRGPILIHAGKTFDEEGACWLIHNKRALNLCSVEDEIEFLDAIEESRKYRGGIVGQADMTNCVQTHPSPFFFGPNGFVMDNPKQVEFIPMPGKLGIFNVPDLALRFK